MTQQKAAHCIFNVMRNRAGYTPTMAKRHEEIFLRAPRKDKIDFLAENAEQLISNLRIPPRVLELAAGTVRATLP